MKGKETILVLGSISTLQFQKQSCLLTRGGGHGHIYCHHMQRCYEFATKCMASHTISICNKRTSVSQINQFSNQSKNPAWIRQHLGAVAAVLQQLEETTHIHTIVTKQDFDTGREKTSSIFPFLCAWMKVAPSIFKIKAAWRGEVRRSTSFKILFLNSLVFYLFIWHSFHFFIKIFITFLLLALLFGLGGITLNS